MSPINMSLFFLKTDELSECEKNSESSQLLLVLVYVESNSKVFTRKMNSDGVANIVFPVNEVH